jgi:hypothetical protein
VRGESSDWQKSFRDVDCKKDLRLLFPEDHGENSQIIDFCSDLSYQKTSSSQHKLTNSLRSSKNHDLDRKPGQILANLDENEVPSYNFRMVVLSKAAEGYMMHYIEVKYTDSCRYAVYELRTFKNLFPLDDSSRCSRILYAGRLHKFIVIGVRRPAIKLPAIVDDQIAGDKGDDAMAGEDCWKVVFKPYKIDFDLNAELTEEIYGPTVDRLTSEIDMKMEYLESITQNSTQSGPNQKPKNPRHEYLCAYLFVDNKPLLTKLTVSNSKTCLKYKDIFTSNLQTQGMKIIQPKENIRKFSVLAICLLKPVKLVEADILKSGHLMVAYGSSRLANLAIRTTEAEIFTDTDMSLFNLVISKINSMNGSVSDITWPIQQNGITQGKIRSVA